MTSNEFCQAASVNVFARCSEWIGVTKGIGLEFQGNSLYACAASCRLKYFVVYNRCNLTYFLNTHANSTYIRTSFAYTSAVGSFMPALTWESLMEQ